MLAAINLGEILWSLLVIYVMIMYFVIVISVIFDIFRSDDMAGFAKAMWCIALIIFPFVTLIVYLIARGRSMGERNQARADAARADADAYIRSVASPTGGAASELEKAKSLLDSGGITQAEYDQLKGKLLA